MTLLWGTLGVTGMTVATRILDHICRGLEPDSHYVGALISASVGAAFLVLALIEQRREYKLKPDRRP